MEGILVEISNFLYVNSFFNGLMENLMEDFVLVGVELIRFFLEVSVFSKFFVINDFFIYSYVGLSFWVCLKSFEDVFNNFFYWRISFFDISKDLELFLSEVGL